MAVVLNGERFISTLVKVPAAAGMVVFVVPAHMGHAEPAHEAFQFLVTLWPQQKVPVIGHQAIRQNVHVGPFTRFADDAEERVIVRRLVEQVPPTVTAVQHMVDDTPAGVSSFPSHAPIVADRARKSINQ